MEPTDGEAWRIADDAVAQVIPSVCAPTTPHYSIPGRLTHAGAVRMKRRWETPDAPGLVRGLVVLLARWAVSTYRDERGVGCSRWVAARRVWRQRRWVIST